MLLLFSNTHTAPPPPAWAGASQNASTCGCCVNQWRVWTFNTPSRPSLRQPFPCITLTQRSPCCVAPCRNSTSSFLASSMLSPCRSSSSCIGHSLRRSLRNVMRFRPGRRNSVAAASPAPWSDRLSATRGDRSVEAGGRRGLGAGVMRSGGGSGVTPSSACRNKSASCSGFSFTLAYLCVPKYLSTSRAAMQPVAALVQAWR